jgi:N-acetyltransferase
MDDLRQRLGSLDASDLTGRGVRLERLADDHREGLRAACAADTAIWEIYPYSMLGEAFDAWWAKVAGSRFVYVAVIGDDVAGMSSFYDVDPANASVAIGGTYFVPAVRGTAVNGEVKRLMLGAAFAAGARRVVFHIDAINGRSRRAIEKLGATFEGIMRRDRVTWTGRVRDTCVYSILDDEWPAIRAKLVQP